MSHPIEARNFLDRAIEAVAPGYAATRYAARASIEIARSMPEASYRGAVATRTSQTWGRSTSFTGGSQKDRRDLASMRDRARRVYRENAIGRSLLNTETDNVIAEGFTLQMGTASTDFNKEAEDRFYKWLDRADVAGKATASELFRMSWREPRKDGDGGFVLSTVRGYPRLQYVPGDLIRNPYKGYDPRTMFDGVECDPSGLAVRFWVRDVDEMGKDTSTPIDARDFVYIPHLDDPLAVRGSTVFGPIFELLDQLDTYRDSVTKAAIMACIFGLIEKRKNPAAAMSALGTIANNAGEQQKAITLDKGGMLKVIGSEDSVFQVQAQQPMNQTPDFIRALSRIAAIGFDMPLEVALRDLSQVNFSGGQLGMKGYERTCRVRQDWSKSICWNRITYWWLSIERRRQDLGYPDAFKNKFPDDYGVFELHPREWLLRDRAGEAKADLMEYAIGVNNPQRACAQRGVDYGDNRRLMIEHWKANEADGLPNVLPTEAAMARTTVTAVDADGNPVAGANAPLNGVQITSAMAVLAQAGEKTLPAEAAAVLLTKLGIPEDAAKALAKSAAESTGLTPGDRDFERQFLLKLMDVQGAKQVLYNITNIPSLAENTGLPLDKTVQTTPDQGVPLLPVVADSGPLVSGDSINDPAGDLVGGDVENDAPAEPSPGVTKVEDGAKDKTGADAPGAEPATP